MKLQLVLASSALLALAACGQHVRLSMPCDGGDCNLPLSGEATLHARALVAPDGGDNYPNAVISFKHATTVDSDEVHNDWDLLFGNDPQDGKDRFTANIVVDDQSWIVDLGAISLDSVPGAVNPSDYPADANGRHDSAAVALNHVYYVRTIDSDTRQVAAFRVGAWEADKSVTIEWFRSTAPDTFVFPHGTTR